MYLSLISILISIWVGSIIFFSAIVAPTVFKSLDEKNAGVFLRAFFPKYYNFGILLGVASLALMYLSGIIPVLNYSLFAINGLMLAFTIIGKMMIPLINNARDLGESGEKKFKILHLISVILNVITLIIGIIFLTLVY
mgnify:CR=1 FL=1